MYMPWQQVSAKTLALPAYANLPYRPLLCRYKFCVAMENSIRQDYMTEKMWDALAAGCVPIYLGSSNAPQIIPDSSGVVM